MKRKILIAIITLIIVNVVIFFDRETFTRYVSKGNTSLSIDIAVPIMNDNREETLRYKLDNINPGDIKTYNFDVTNYENENISHVSMNYTIEIIKSDNIPFDIFLYKNGSEISCLNSNFVCGVFTLSHLNRQTDEYTLRIEWNASSNIEEYNNLTDYLDIKILGIQKVD